MGSEAEDLRSDTSVTVTDSVGEQPPPKKNGARGKEGLDTKLRRMPKRLQLSGCRQAGDV